MGVAGISAARTAPESLRELRISPVMAEKELNLKHNAPAKGSYETVLTGFLYYAESWNDLPSGVNTPNGIYLFPTDGGEPAPPLQRELM